ncbi:MAG: NTP transferase domain-containing protein [Oceanospirillaceae bacterium]|nr:NTP transferase domain-containing protein [Oceanospirillaceae bacterium]
MNILIPMAGQGSRFVKDGYEKPKPFIDVNGEPMILRVLENLKYDEATYILIAQKEHVLAEPKLVNRISEQFNVTWITVDRLTEGTACTVLHARELINNEIPLLIANSDQLIDGGISEMIGDAKRRNLAGSILCFSDPYLDPKWSFAKIDDSGYVIEVKEKEVISEFATVGIYYFQKGSYFVDAAVDMIVRNDRVNNEFYTCPVYNYVIKRHKKVGVNVIRADDMHGIGTPKDLQRFLREHT